MKWVPVAFFCGLALAGCARRESGSDDLAGVPLSPELRPAIEASRRSLKQGDGGDPRVLKDLDNYYAIQQMFAGKATHAAAEDSLYALWNSDVSSVLWPELAAVNRTDRSAFNAMLLRAGISDSTSARGIWLRELKNCDGRTIGAGVRRAWEARAGLRPFEQVWLTYLLAWHERDQGRTSEAIRLLIDVLPTARKLGGWRLEMRIWLATERALRQGDHLDDALHAAEITEALARAISRETGNSFIVTAVLFDRAEVLAARRETGPALELYAAGADSSQARGFASMAAVFLTGAGILTARTGQFEEGLAFYRRGLAFARGNQDSVAIQTCLANIARRHLLLGDPDSCRVYVEEAERCVIACPAPGSRARLPILQAEYFTWIGDFAKADSLLALAGRLEPNHSTVAALSELHTELIKLGIEADRADQVYRSIAVVDSLRVRLGTTFADRNEIFDLERASGEFFSRQGMFARAGEALDRADSALSRKPDPGRLWELMRTRGDLARRRNDLRDAERAYRDCLALSEKQERPDLVAESRLRLGSALMEQHRYSSVGDIFPDESGQAFGGRFRTRLSTVILRAAAESRAGHFQAALAGLEEARRLCRPASPPDLVARIDLETGHALAGIGRREDARNAYERVKKTLQAGPRHVSGDSPLFFDGDTRRELAESMLTLAGGSGATPLTGEAAAAVLGELETILPEWLGARGREPDAGGGVSGHNAGRFTEPQIVYFVGRNTSFRWTIAGGTISMQRLPGEDSLLAVMGPVLADMRQPGRRPVPAELAALAATLGGLPPGWRPDETLTIVPDGPLFAVPWAALPLTAAADQGQENSASNREWIDRGPVVLGEAPSHLRPPLPRAGTDHLRLLSLGVDGSGSQLRLAGLTPLRHAEEEARDIHSRWPAQRGWLRLGPQADWRALDPRELSTCDVIHIASHALVYQGQADRTTLLLAGSSGAPLTSAEIGKTRLHAELVFLSCCEAAEEVRRGAGPAHAGLARAFLTAGARTVIAPGTAIDDETARRFAGRFYDHWLSGQSIEAALRSAQLDLRDGDQTRSHPYYWAFYQLISV